MPSINGIVSEQASWTLCINKKMKELRRKESVIRWNLTCLHNNLKGTGVVE